MIDGPDNAPLRCLAEPFDFRCASANDEQAGLLETGEGALQAKLRQLQDGRASGCVILPFTSFILFMLFMVRPRFH